jgi:thiol-disulfide isomerase/thioredoxin
MYSMDPIKKTVCITSLIAIFILATGFNAVGAQYSVGSGNDDWWTKYPDQSAGKGNEVNHPDWVLDALKSKPVLIYVHKSCDYCKPQTEAIEKIAAEFDGRITFYEISAEGGDSRAEEALQAYDPNGGVMYVPLTVVVTLAPNSEGSVEPVWHSTEDVTGEDWIKNYVEDALGKYSENSAAWNK